MSPRSARREADEAIARLVAEAVAYACAVPFERVAAIGRGTREAAFARQMAMYLTHTLFGLTLSRTADAFGRDRTTVAHACQLIEDRREEPEIDAQLEALEDFLANTPQRRGPQASGEGALAFGASA